MSYSKEAMDRWITGNYGEDNVTEFCDYCGRKFYCDESDTPNNCGCHKEEENE